MKKKTSLIRVGAEWLSIAVTLLVFDLFWLGSFAHGFYSEHLGDLMRPQADRLAAALFYLFYVTVIWATAVRGAQSRREAGRRGASLGLVCYGVYELTNWAVITGWPVILVPVDWVWGIFLTGLAAAAGRLTWRSKP